MADTFVKGVYRNKTTKEFARITPFCADSVVVATKLAPTSVGVRVTDEVMYLAKALVPIEWDLVQIV